MRNETHSSFCMVVTGLVALAFPLVQAACTSAGGGSPGSDADTDTDTDADTNADSDTDSDTDTGTEESSCEEDCAAQGLVCNESSGICVVASCEGQEDFTPCALTTAPDRSYDICVDGICVSPGCGDATCNTPGPHFPIPDTNQRQCYDGAAEMSCPSSGEDFFGQDAQYGWDTAHSVDERFTRELSVPGEPTVLDNVTELVWQGCALGLEGDDCANGEATWLYWSDALAGCDALEWAGHDDWRLPDPQELGTLFDFGGISAPFTFAASFPATPIGGFSWTSSSRRNVSQNAWVADFVTLEMLDLGKSLPAHARCVRGGAPLGGRRFEAALAAGDRVVEDTVTGLAWQGCPLGKTGENCTSGGSTEFDWQGALAACEGLSWGGHDDWRLPSLAEIQSLADFRVYDPSIDTDAFPGTTVDYYWSSTSRADDPAKAMNVHFLFGVGAIDWLQEKTDENLVRCVRDGN